jgi:hypothetical protein
MRKDSVRTILNLALIVASFICPAGLAQAPVSPGFDVQNASHSPITAAFAKPVASQKWGSPLPGSAIAAGKTARVTVASETNCLYDVRLVFADGHEESRHSVDVCKHDHVRTQP